jgi:PncC family amidohydrolase
MGLEEEIGQLLRAGGLTLSTAESCTGGLLGHRITDVPGSSDYFLGGVISYSDEAKRTLLGVDQGTLLEQGAVSEAAAREMARGVKGLFHSDLALSITGIAGPSGGTREKPVGLVYIALATPDEELCRRYIWPGDRVENKRRSAEQAMQILKEYMEGR